MAEVALNESSDTISSVLVFATLSRQSAGTEL